MAKLWKRIWQLIRGKTNAVLDHLEDPEQQLSVFVSELNEQIADLQRSVTSAVADEKRLKIQIDGLLEKGNEWEERAVLALENGEEALARDALVQKEECEAQALALQPGWEAQKEATEQLKTSLKGAKTRVMDQKRQYTLLLARYKSAETRQKIEEAHSPTGSEDSPALLMDRLEERIHQIEAETEANNVLRDAGNDVDLDARFLELEKRSAGADALEALKSRLAEQSRLNPGTGPTEDHVDELKRSLDDE